MRFWLFLAFAVLFGCIPFQDGRAQSASQPGVSSDDISVADGLQLPTYGHVWALDTWQGLKELVRLVPPDTTDSQGGFSLKLRHSIEFKGEAARVRVHDTEPLFFVRGVSGGGNGHSDVVIVRLAVDGERRAATRDTGSELKQLAKHPEAQFPDIIAVTQKRVGTTDWYRIAPSATLSNGEYALVPLPSSSGFAEGEIFDFAIDPDAPENANPLRSEQYRGAE
jgi:hypothetical protein